MKKLIVLLFFGALSFVSSSFAPANEMVMTQNVEGSVTTCPACGYEETEYNVDAEIFTCPICGCKWKKVNKKNVVIVSPPKEPSPAV